MVSENNSIKKYSKPPIQEAVFDLRTQNEVTFSEQLFKNFLDKASEYSLQEPLRNININADDMTKNIEIIGYRCISADQKQIVQFKKNGFSFSRLTIYDGWDKNYKEALKLWKHYYEVVKPTVITRVATRFINKFEIPYTFKPEEYFKTYIQYDKSISLVWNQMSYRLLLPHSNGIKSHIIFDNNVNQSSQNVNVLFDIDVFSDNLGLTDNSNLESIFNQVRIVKNDIFEKSITDKTRKMIT
ncbi:MAG: TIGR04255 family protein [Oligoflexia bacterium]|nr:TIGR04255 family protein [Oligoflexia bacterium]